MRDLKHAARACALLFLLCLAAAPAFAKDNDFDAVVKSVKVNCGGKKMHVPFLGLAGFATKLVRPAGVKSFKLAMFESVKVGDAHALGEDLRRALGEGWSPLVRARTRDGQAYVYYRESGDDLKLIVVVLGDGQATVARVRLNPQALAKFAEDPQILGISLGD
ncbi:MAG TPA: hypothetical protein VLJ61_13945 [Pyrinomonadaceae bacterium]|nr:hypothetical protein [Pyrinomonadaceae bacterium]